MEWPLCKSSILESIAQSSSSDICSAYARRLGCDINFEFGEIHNIELVHCRGCDLRFSYPMIGGSPQFYALLSQKMPERYY